MAEYKLALEKREITGKKLKALRAKGLVPSVVYGGKEPVLASSEYVPTEKVLEKAGYHSPIDLDIAGKKQLAIVKDVHIDPVSRKIINIEFRAVRSSIHFHTITEEALESWEDLGIREDDYVEILIKQSHVSDHEKTIKKLVDLFGATTTPLPEENNIIFESTEVLNVDSVCRKMLPEKLKGPYQQMVEALSKKE